MKTAIEVSVEDIRRGSTGHGKALALAKEDGLIHPVVTAWEWKNHEDFHRLWKAHGSTFNDPGK